MLHALGNVNDAGQKYSPDANNAARDFTPYFILLIIEIPLSLRCPEKSLTALYKFNLSATSLSLQKKVKTKQKTLSGVIENYTRSKNTNIFENKRFF